MNRCTELRHVAYTLRPAILVLAFRLLYVIRPSPDGLMGLADRQSAWWIFPAFAMTGLSESMAVGHLRLGFQCREAGWAYWSTE